MLVGWVLVSNSQLYNTALWTELSVQVYRIWGQHYTGHSYHSQGVSASVTSCFQSIVTLIPPPVEDKLSFQMNALNVQLSKPDIQYFFWLETKSPYSRFVDDITMGGEDHHSGCSVEASSYSRTWWVQFDKAQYRHLIILAQTCNTSKYLQWRFEELKLYL